MPTKSARRSGRPTKASWKDVQYRSKLKKRSKLALVVLALIGFLLLASLLFQLGRSLLSPWRMPQASARTYTWSGEFNINLVVRTNSISLLSYNPKEQKIIIINIPDETYLDLPYGFGKWQMRSVYDLGGGKLLEDTLVSFLGIPVDGLLDFEDPFDEKSTADLVDILRQNPFSGFNLLASMKTDLTPLELLRLKIAFLSVRFDKIKKIDLTQSGILDREILPDGSEVLTADPVKLDSVLTDLADPTIVAERATIAVLNATEVPQLAQKAARLISNLGGDVIIKSNAKEKIKNTQITGQESATLKRLKQIFPIHDKIKPEAESIESRAQINVLLGEDYYRNLP